MSDTMCVCGHRKSEHNEFVGGGHPCYHSQDGTTFCACEEFVPTTITRHPLGGTERE